MIGLEGGGRRDVTKVLIWVARLAGIEVFY